MSNVDEVSLSSQKEGGEGEEECSHHPLEWLSLRVVEKLLSREFEGPRSCLGLVFRCYLQNSTGGLNSEHLFH